MDCQLTALMHAGHVGPAFLSPWLLAVLFLLVGRWLYLRPRCLPADVLGLVKSSSAREAVPYKHVLLCVCTSVATGRLPASGVAGSQ